MQCPCYWADDAQCGHRSSSTLYTAQFTLHTTHFTLQIGHCILHTAYKTLHTSQRNAAHTVHTLHPTHLVLPVPFCRLVGSTYMWLGAIVKQGLLDRVQPALTNRPSHLPTHSVSLTPRLLKRYLCNTNLTLLEQARKVQTNAIVQMQSSWKLDYGVLYTSGTRRSFVEYWKSILGQTPSNFWSTRFRRGSSHCTASPQYDALILPTLTIASSLMRAGSVLLLGISQFCFWVFLSAFQRWSSAAGSVGCGEPALENCPSTFPHFSTTWTNV